MEEEKSLPTHFAKIYIQTNESFYFPHSFIEGSVFVNLLTEVSKFQIDLLIEGVEKVQWEEINQNANKNESSSGIIYEKIKEESELFFPHKVTLKSFDSKIGPGDFEFPFSFILPSGLPGTCKFVYELCEAKLSYSITALLISQQYETLKSKTKLVVREPFPIYPPIQNMTKFTISTIQKPCICFIPRGESHLEGILMNSNTGYYISGEDVYILLNCNNLDSSIGIKIFELRLIQYLTLRNKLGKSKYYRNVVCKKEFDGIEAYQNNREQPKMMSVTLTEKQLDLMTPKEELSKLYLPPTISTQLIEIKYEIVVSPIFDTGLTMACSQIQDLHFPIKVYEKEPNRMLFVMNQSQEETKVNTFEKTHIIIPSRISTTAEIENKIISTEKSENSKEKRETRIENLDSHQI